MSLKDAINQKIINNKTLGYYMGRTYLFLMDFGIDEKLLRFRQHKENEMAHYARDCWDAEILMSYGWIECVRVAARSCYDLKCHEKASKVNLKCKKRLTEPREAVEWILNLDKKKWGPKLKNKFSIFEKWLMEYIESNLKSGNEGTYLEVEFEGFMIDILCEKIKRKIFIENITSDVIEHSFGIGRILYALFEHSFYLREDKRSVFGFKPIIAPVHCGIGYLIHSSDFDEHIMRIKRILSDNGLTVHVNDRSCSIGRKYASCDELGIPFFITFDPDFTKDNKREE
eukprot:GHVR01099109.1.p1 GENE.GHVR01099109.1~~GHVR01099109.1.p1  ORF type:complete len:285 (-),score=33.94 GHVR01099109.1:564-1418(-)